MQREMIADYYVIVRRSHCTYRREIRIVERHGSRRKLKSQRFPIKEVPGCRNERARSTLSIKWAPGRGLDVRHSDVAIHFRSRVALVVVQIVAQVGPQRPDREIVVRVTRVIIVDTIEAGRPWKR